MLEMLVQFLIRLSVWSAVLIVITWLPWPHVPAEVYSSLSLIVAYANSFNDYLPIDTMLQYTLTVFVIEGSLMFIRLASRIGSFFAGEKMPFDSVGKTADENSGQQPPTSLPF